MLGAYPYIRRYINTVVGGQVMAGAVRRMAVYLGLVEDDSYNDDYLDDSRDSQGRDSQSTQ